MVGVEVSMISTGVNVGFSPGTGVQAVNNRENKNNKIRIRFINNSNSSPYKKSR